MNIQLPMWTAGGIAYAGVLCLSFWGSAYVTKIVMADVSRFTNAFSSVMPSSIPVLPSHKIAPVLVPSPVSVPVPAYTVAPVMTPSSIPRMTSPSPTHTITVSPTPTPSPSLTLPSTLPPPPSPSPKSSPPSPSVSVSSPTPSITGIGHEHRAVSRN